MSGLRVLAQRGERYVGRHHPHDLPEHLQPSARRGSWKPGKGFEINA
jgi:hypothetical protein